MKEDKNYVLTTVVDLCYKFQFLDNKETAKKWLLEEVQTAFVSVNKQTTDKDKDNRIHVAAERETTEGEKPAKKTDRYKRTQIAKRGNSL